MSRPSTPTISHVGLAAAREPGRDALSPSAIAMLRRPAGELAGPSSPSLHLWSHIWMAHAEARVATTLRRAVSIRHSTSGQSLRPRVDRIAYAIRITHPWFGDGVLVALEAPLCRAIVDALETDLAALRGVGPLTAVEEGLMDFASLAIADGSEATDAGVQVDALVAGDDARQAVAVVLRDRSSRALAMRMTVGTRHGRLWLVAGESSDPRLPDLDAASLERAMEGGACQDKASASRESLPSLHVALPPVPLSPIGAASVETGDVLLLGADELTSIGPRISLVTSTGWSLGSVRIRRIDALFTVVELNELTLRLPDLGDGGGCQAICTIGQTRLQERELCDLRPGAEICVPHQEPEVLVHGLRGSPWCATLARCEEQVAVRLLRPRRSLGFGHAQDNCQPPADGGDDA